MSIKSELHEAILRKGGKIPTHGGIAAALDELNRLPSGGGVTSWNDLTDKPFGTEIGMVEVLGETTVEIEDGQGVLPFLDLVEGVTYTVDWNGTEYECVCAAFSANGMGGNSLGDISSMGGVGNGEPFAIVAVPADSGTLVVALDGSTTVTLSIHTEGEIVKKISGKYVEGMGYTEIEKDVTRWSSKELTFTDGQAVLDENIGLIAGETYSVFWGGGGVNHYNCVAVDYVESGNVFGAMIGNVGAMTGGEDTGEPFVIISFNAAAAAAMDAHGLAMDLNGASSVVVTLTGAAEIVTPIDLKFIVLTSPNGTKYNLSVADDGTLSAFATS